MKLTFRIFTVFSMIVFTLALAVRAHADTVTDWNRIAVQEVVIAARPGASGALDVATVQLAVYDAVQACRPANGLNHAFGLKSGGTTTCVSRRHLNLEGPSPIAWD